MSETLNLADFGEAIGIDPGPERSGIAWLKDNRLICGGRFRNKLITRWLEDLWGHSIHFVAIESLSVWDQSKGDILIRTSECIGAWKYLLKKGNITVSTQPRSEVLFQLFGSHLQPREPGSKSSKGWTKAQSRQRLLEMFGRTDYDYRGVTCKRCRNLSTPGKLNGKLCPQCQGDWAITPPSPFAKIAKGEDHIWDALAVLVTVPRET